MTDNPVSQLNAALAGRYVVDREIGAGGMATVYLATDVKHHRNVALKVLRPELAAIVGADRFLKEIEVTANLQHPNILPLYDSGGVGSVLFYVMPFVEGETLRDRLGREHQLPVDDALEIAKNMAAALQYAHSHKVIHRDIKPGNVLLQGGQAIIADFGIALAVSQAGGNRLTETGLSLGTPHYMSPEQATGDRILDARSDIYSLGAVVYEMLAGDPPHSGSSAQSVLAKVLTEEPVPLSKARSLVPANVEAAVQRALAKAPADRFKSAAEFAQALTNASYTLPTTSLHAARAQRGALAGWRLGAAVGGALAIGAMAGIMLAPGADGEKQTVAFSFPVQLASLTSGSAIDISPDGKTVVYVGRDDMGRSTLFRRTLAERQSTAIPGTTGSLTRLPKVSADGHLVAWVGEGALKVAELAGSGSVRKIGEVASNIGGLAWGTGGQIVYQPAYGKPLILANIDGRPSRELNRIDTSSTEEYRFPHFLPDGKRLLVTIWNGQPERARIALLSVDGGAARPLFPGSSAVYASGYVVFVAPDRTLQTVPFDEGSATVTGQAMAVADRVDLFGDGAGQFALSRNGTLAYARSLGRNVPMLVDRLGNATPTAIPPGPYLSPRFSPDGKSFVVELQGGAVWVYSFATSTFSKLTDDGGFYGVWTPDGKRVLYSLDEQSSVNIYSVPVDRSSPPTPIVKWPGQQRTQDLSPDGRHLMIRRNTGPGQYDLFSFRMDSAGAKPQPWLATPFLDRAPTFSRDGRWIAYSSDESSRDEIYVRPFPGPGGRIQVSTDGGTEPVWSPDGKEIYYREGNEFRRVGVEVRPAFRVTGRPERLIPSGTYFSYPWHRQYDVHPDGKHLLLLRTESGANDINVTVNWLASIRKTQP